MASLNYSLVYTSGSSIGIQGLAPTFTVFKDAAGNNITSPAISQIASTGFYTFAFEATLPIFFVADAATTSLSGKDRYIYGALYPSDRILDYTGDTTSVIGDNATDPTTMFGFLKRIQELYEGRQNYAKGTGTWSMYDRSGATLLRTRVLTESGSAVTKAV